MASRVFIVEDHVDFRRMLEELLSVTDGMEFCGSSESAEAALAQFDQARADLMLIDLSLPGMSGFELLALLREQAPQIPCVILSAYRSTEHAETARQAGARAYLSKTEVGELVTVLREVLQGGSRFRAYD